MTGQDIIERFQEQIDDSSELSSSEELDLCNEIYQEIQDDRDWNFLKKTFTGNTSTSLPYVALPADFKKLAFNYNDEQVVFVGAYFTPYRVIPFEERRAYRDWNNVCYVDLVTNRLYFTKQPTTVEAIEYDYIMVAPVLTTSTSPVFPRNHQIISYGMAAKFPSIEQADKGTSYANENKREYLKLLSDMATQDALLKLSI